MRTLIGRFPLTLFGAACVAVVVASAGHPALEDVSGVLRILVLPMYPFWLGVSILQVWLVGSAPSSASLSLVFAGAQLAAGLVPYVGLDLMLFWWGREASSGARST